MLETLDYILSVLAVHRPFYISIWISITLVRKQFFFNNILGTMVRTFWIFLKVLDNAGPWLVHQMKAYEISNNTRAECISPKLSSEVISHLVHNWYIFILFLKFPQSVVRNGEFQTAQESIKLLDFTFQTARENSQYNKLSYF